MSAKCGQCFNFNLISSLSCPVFAFAVGGLGFEFCVLVVVGGNIPKLNRPWHIIYIRHFILFIHLLTSLDGLFN